MPSGTWTSVATSGAWNTTSNWSGAVVANGSGFTANFTSNITATTTIDTTTGANWSGIIGSITFSDSGFAGSAWTLGSQSTVTFAGGTPTITTTTDATFNGAIAGSAALIKAGAGTLTLSGVSAYTGTFTLNAGNTIVTFDGGVSGFLRNTTTINAATLTIKNYDLFGYHTNSAAPSVVINSGGTLTNSTNPYLTTVGPLTLNGGNLTSGAQQNVGFWAGSYILRGGVSATDNSTIGTFPIAIGPDAVSSSTGTIVVSAGKTLTISSRIDNTPNTAFNALIPTTLTLNAASGTGTLKVTSGASTYSGGTTIAAGSVQLGASTTGAVTSGPLGLGTVTMQTGTTLSSDSTTARTLSNALSLSGTLTFGNATLNGALTLSGATTFTGTASVTHLSPNAFTGTVMVNSGTVTINSDGSTLGVFQGATTINSATVVVNNYDLFGYHTNAAAPTLTINSGGTLTNSTNPYLTTVGPLVLAGGTLTSGAQQTAFGIWTGAYILRGGVSATATSTISGFPIAVGSDTSPTGLINVAAGKTLTISANIINTPNTAFNALLATGLTLQTGTGTLTLTGTNSYTGAVAVSAGTLNANSATALGSASSTAAITVSSGATLSLGAATSYSSPGRTTTINGTGVSTAGALVLAYAGTANVGAISLGAAAYIRGTETGTLSGNVTLGANALTAGASATKTFTLSGVIASTTAGNGLVVGAQAADTGTVVLSGANTYTGTTTLAYGTTQAGVAQVGSTSGPFGTSGTINMTGGTLQYSASNNTDYSARLGTGTNGQWRIDTNGRDVTFNSMLSGATSSLVKIGAGTLALTASNPFGGGTRISGGTLSFVIGGLSNVGNIVVNGGTLQWGSGVTTDLSDRLVLENGGSASVSMSSTVSFASPVGSSSTSSFTKLGTGDLLMGSANGTWSGATTVSAGSMSIKTLNSGSYSAAIVVNGLSLGVYPTSGTTQTLSGAISGSGKMILNPDATSTIIVSGGSNSYLGGTTLAGGKIVAGNASAFGTGTLTFVSVGAQPVIDVSTPAVISNAINLDDGYIIFAGSNNLELSSNINLPFSRPFTVNGSVLTLSGIVSGSGSKLTKSGTGTLKLTGANTYSGGSDLDAGTTQAGNTQALGTSGTVTLTASGATLQTLTTGGQNGKLTVASLNNAAGGTIKIGG